MGERLKILRRELGLNQSEFGRKVGLTTPTISRIEKNITNLTKSNIISISNLFNVRLEWLISGDGDMFETVSEDIIGLLYKSKDLSPAVVEMFELYLRQDDKAKAVIEKFINDFVALYHALRETEETAGGQRRIVDSQ
ncbi:MAG: helix-turn-helix domain-containing protein [Oscillospiraceae bacterium]|jgi:transcriptional regulator with XRE-family HTH domain|nr:helix-turn-helix domain-containing protein [Oscillospiraceae bacterium]